MGPQGRSGTYIQHCLKYWVSRIIWQNAPVLSQNIDDLDEGTNCMLSTTSPMFLIARNDVFNAV
jgi:hypothetical protein